MFRNIIFFLLLFYSTSLLSMDVFGKIVDSKGNPIIDAYILKPDGTFHTSSNELGIFTCENLQIGDTLIISYLGFKPKEIIVHQQPSDKILNIVLEEAFFNLAQVQISNSSKTITQIANINLKTNPVNSSQEILRKVPGLFIGQHAGGGKAEQLFLRGFDIDHGTDIAVTMDGIPINMVSHAHGQGYADLHFLIPETVERLDFGKGPYYADKGNFTTAGYVNFETKDQIENNQIGLEIGRFNNKRAIALIDLLGKSKRQNAYLASEYILNDGPFESPQNFRRFNLMGKYNITFSNNDKVSFLASFFNSEWNASGQIPQRAVDNGLIGRFGAIDDTEGGITGRTNIALNYTKTIGNQSFIKNKFYFSNYHFELFSNFTFFENDPINGDQIRQNENRNLLGLESVWYNTIHSKIGIVNLKAGAGFRTDRVNNLGLWRTLNRNTSLSTLAQGTVKESNYYAFNEFELTKNKWLISAGLRVDYFNFSYHDELLSANSQLNQKDIIFSPKLNVLFTPTNQFQYYFKSGIGFHSNDSRVVVAQSDKQTLPGAFGLDFGINWKPTSNLWINTALWYLFLQQEFVYVGDEAIVEPSGKTNRYGIDLSLRWQIKPNLFYNIDLNYTIARSIEAAKKENYIPLAPELTMTGGLTFQFENGFSSSLSYRFIKNRPANEDNSIIAKGYFITDLAANYKWKQFSFGLAAENLFNKNWNEAQFATLSKLKNEMVGVEELHFTPGVPFFLKGKIVYSF